MAVKTHVATPASTNTQGLTRNQFEKSCLFFVRARNPSGLILVPCTLSAVDKRGRKNVDLHKHTHKYTEKVVQGTLPE